MEQIRYWYQVKKIIGAEASARFVQKFGGRVFAVSACGALISAMSEFCTTESIALLKSQITVTGSTGAMRVASCTRATQKVDVIRKIQAHARPGSTALSISRATGIPRSTVHMYKASWGSDHA